MKKVFGQRVEQYRTTKGPMASTLAREGRNGAFTLPASLLARTDTTYAMSIVISDASSWPEHLGPVKWEHVSAAWPDRCPSWSEMCRVKSLFFNVGEIVVQFHPAEREYVNCHPHCLHLWRPLDVLMITPPAEAVGPLS